MEKVVDLKFDPEVTGEWAVYRRFIEMVRKELTFSQSHNRPVLQPEQKGRVEWFQVLLEDVSHKNAPDSAGSSESEDKDKDKDKDEGKVRLRIRRDNLYLEGYKTKDSKPWVVFGNGTPSTSFLGFGESYKEMATAAGLRVDQITLGPRDLQSAMVELATEVRQKRAKGLIIVVQMICESVRYSRITDHLANPRNWSRPPPSWMIALEHGWGNLSNALLRADADPTKFFRLPQPNDMQITTAEGAAAALGILKFFDYRKTGVILDDSRVLSRQGRRMAEVFWVRIDGVGGGAPAQLHGTIAIADGLSSQSVYNRQRASPETVPPGGGRILLTGPARAISAYDTFIVDLSLQNRAAPNRDDEVSNGSIIWNVFDAANVFDRMLHADVKGARGSARVCYVVLSDAVEATISVELVNADGKNPAEVYGEIAASYANYPSGEQTLLFQRKREEHINVRPGQPIGLAKTTVAVPTDYSLSVRAELYDRHTTSAGREIAKGVAAFPPLFTGASHNNVTGQHGSIRVTVTWNPSWRA